MAEYRALRAKHDMLEMIFTPELAAEVTLQPIDKIGIDAAIIFADILPPLIGMGLNLEFVPGKGPVIDNALTTTYDIDMLATPPAEETLAPTLKAIEMVAAELAPREHPAHRLCRRALHAGFATPSRAAAARTTPRSRRSCTANRPPGIDSWTSW